MQKQKTIAKWLAVLLLLTIAVASYVALSAIFNGRGSQGNVAGAQDGNDSDIGDVEDPGDEKTPPTTDDDPPHIPVYSEFPRAAEKVGALSVLDIGGEDDDKLLDRITCYGKYILVFSSASQEYDVRQSGIHIAAIDEEYALENVVFIAGSDEEYVDCTLSAGGLLIVTRNDSQTILRLLSRELKITLKNSLPRYDSYSLFTSGGVLRMYAANVDGVSVYTISKTLSASKSNRVAELPLSSIACVVPTSRADMLLLQTDSGISVYTYSTNEGFIAQSELMNCVFVQIMPISTDGEQCFALLASSDEGCKLTRLDSRGKQCESYLAEGASSAAILKNGTNVTMLAGDKKYTFCSHIELTACETLNKAETIEGAIAATPSGTLYCVSGDGVKLLALSNNELSVTLSLAGASQPMFFDSDLGCIAAYSCENSDLGGKTFGKSDVYFVIDSGKQI